MKRGDFRAKAAAKPLLNEPRFAESAARAASFILSEMQRDRRLLRTYRDGKTGQTTNLSLQHATLGASSPADPLKLDIDGAFNDLAFQVAGRVGSVEAMSRPGTPFPVNLSGKIADATTFKIDGIVRAEERVRRLERRLDALERGSLRTLARR